ncbi:uncharacterized protein DUF4270 [Gillisia sp. Hel_I_86]|uniref:DUF4270 domain-containing protein n=1 Tax=Gillisia sp. Hel_I_86 TaxID=1249981 RepID=UPI00119A7703|nr:DUF4270 domain-containing protein [Gillisia sp. Hel_I_86]TVZ26465.1 uncharacterized protein DUF4270 [Gillisia sp. Hel_I_86]
MNFLKRARLVSVAMLLVLAFTSCDDDFNTIGGRLVGQFDSIPLYEAGVIGYSNKIGPVQTNGRTTDGTAINLLGIYNDPVYGQQVASVLTQLSLSTTSPEFGDQPVVDSVVLTLAYYSTVVETGEDGNPVYELDSIFGDSPYKLTVSRSNFFLNNFDPEADFASVQKYYSNQGPVFENNLIGAPLYTNENFLPSNNEVVYEGFNEQNEVDTIRTTPRLRANLPVQFFQENIINKEGSIELFNNNNFNNFIRGLYFKAEPLNGGGNMLLLDFSYLTNPDVGIMIYYTSQVEDSSDSDGDGDTTEMIGQPASYKLNFGTNTVNTFSQDFPAGIASEITETNSEAGAKNLFLKGGEGVVSVIRLFEDEAELAELRANNWLINEANLTFFVDQDRVEIGESEPERIYLYNLKTNEQLFDYLIDPTLNTESPLNSLISHSSRLERDESGAGVSYKIRITEHIKNVLNKDSTNVKLGLVVTQNINLVGNSALKTVIDSITRVPRASVISPEGTVLHGNLSPNVDKRLKFNIYYTETNN